MVFSVTFGFDSASSSFIKTTCGFDEEIERASDATSKSSLSTIRIFALLSLRI